MPRRVPTTDANDHTIYLYIGGIEKHRVAARVWVYMHGGIYREPRYVSSVWVITLSAEKHITR